LKSTGPRDTSRTRFNGIEHGLTAKHALLPWENPDDLNAIIESYEQRYQPTDNVERLLVKNAAEAYWRMDRSMRFEAAIFEILTLAEVEDSGLKRENMHAGHLEAMAFLKATSTWMGIAAMTRICNVRLIKRSPRRENGFASEPEVPRAKVKIKAALLRLPLPKNQPLKVLGEIFDHESDQQLASSS